MVFRGEQAHNMSHPYFKCGSVCKGNQCYCNQEQTTPRVSVTVIIKNEVRLVYELL